MGDLLPARNIAPWARAVLPFDVWGGGTIGQDGDKYIMEGAFDHPYDPYVKGKNEGCCGWAESIHGHRPSVIECSFCREIVPAERAFESVIRIGGQGYTLRMPSGREFFHDHAQDSTLYFCRELCRDLFIFHHKGCEE